MKRLLLSIGFLLVWTTWSLAQVVAPITESFTASSTPTGWSTSATTGGPWRFSGSNNSVNCPAAFDHTGNSGNYAWMDQSGSDASVILESPDVDVTSLTTPYLEFYYWMCGSGYTPPNLTIVETYDGTNWNVLDSITTATVGWQYFGYDLTGLAYGPNNLVRVRFVAESGGSGSDFFGDNALDDISIIEAPTCQIPTSLSASAVTSSNVTLSWNPVTNASAGYQVIYGTTGFDPATGGTSTTVTTSSLTISTLAGATTYDAYVLADCGATDGLSDTSSAVTFTTLCVPFTAPYSTNFDSGTDGDVDLCWSQYNTYTASAYARVEALSTFNATQPLSGSNVLELYSWTGFTAGTDTLMAITPQFSDLTAGDKQITFSAATIDVINDLYIGTTSGPSGTAPVTIIDTISFSAANTWELNIVTLDAANGYNGTDDYVVLMHSLGGTFDDIYIDDFSYQLIPPCPTPTGQSIIATTDSNATIAWDGGSGTNWDIEWGPVGFTQGTGSVTSVTNDTVTFGPLAENTCYDIYFRSDCSTAGNGVGAWRGPIEFCTQCAPLTAPYSQNFDGTSAPELDNCWRPVVFNPSATNFELQTDAFRNNSPSNSMEIHNASATAGFLGIASPRFSDLDDQKRLEFFAYDEDGQFGGSDLIIGVMSDLTDQTTFTSLDTLTEAEMDNDQWEFFVVDLTNNPILSGGGYVVFRHGMNSTFDNIHIDDFEYKQIPACQTPLVTTLGLAVLGSNGATVNWGAGGQGIKTYVAWGSTGFTPNVAGQIGIDSVAGTVDQYAITGLSPQTTYEFYIQDSCATDGLSPWVGPFSFQTLCNPITAPFLEDFDGPSWVASGSNANNAIDPCWSSDPDVSDGAEPFKWIPRSTGPTSGNGPLNDVTGGNFMYAEASGSASGDTAILVTPSIDVSGLTVPALYFWQHRFGNPAPMDVEVSNNGGGSWANVYSISGNIQSGSGGAFTDVFVNLQQYIGDTILVRFVLNGTGCCGDAAIDSVAIAEAPSCPDPTNLGLASITDTAATLSWTGAITSTSYQTWFGPQGFFQGTLTTTGVRGFQTQSTLLVDTLSSQTCYEYLVRSVCQPGDTSAWTGPFQFCTPCSPISAPYFEDWDGLSTGKDLGCYSSIEDPAFASSNFSGVNIVTFGLPFSAPNQIELDNSSSPQPLAVVSPPTTDLTVGDKRLKFRARQSFNATPPSTLIVGTMTVPTDASTFSPLDTIILNATTPMNEYRVNLDVANGYNGTDEYYAIAHGRDANFRTIYLDDLLYEVIPTCPAPFSGSTLNVSNTTADLQFASGGVATNFQIDFGAPGFTPSGSSSNINNVTTSTPTLTGLTPNTSYEWYVRDSCGAGDVSIWTGPFSFTTLCNAFTAPFFEDFESNTLGFFEGIDNCWLLQNTVNKATATSGYGWDLRNTSQTTSGTGTGADRDNTLAPAIGGQFFNADVSYGSSGDSSMLISPIVDISSLTAPELEYHIHRLGTGMADFYVDIYDGTQWINGVHSYTTTGGIQSAQSDPYTDTIIDLTPYIGITNFQVRFRTVSNGCCSGDNSLDDIRISDPIPGDVDLISADFVKSFCLNANDSITLQVVSTVDTVDFVADNLTGSYNVLGPVNSSGTFTINSGGLGVNDTLTLTLGGIDLSQAGSYSLEAFIDQNANINVFPNRDTINGITLDIQPNLQASPTTVTVATIGDSVELCSSSEFFGAGDFLFTEIRHFAATGAGTVPAYVPDDYIEITGVPGSDLEGITLEIWTGTSAVVNYTFPAGTLIGPNGTAIIMQGQGATVSDPSNFIYDGRGTYTGLFSSGTVAGYILKNGSDIMDAVSYNNYSFSAATGVTAADWTGTMAGSTAGTAGIRATGPDINSAANWTVVSAAVTQDAQVLNPGVTLPRAAGGAGLSWSLVGTPGIIDTLACITVGGPFAATGVQQYVVSFANGCGTFTDTVTVIIPNCSAPSNLTGSSTGTNSVTLSYDTTGTGASSFVIEYGTPGFVLGSGTTTTSNSNTISLTGLANNVCQDFYVRASCTTDSSAWIGPVNVCPDETICTDDIEQYATGDIVSQSALFIGWQGGTGGDGVVSTTRSSSGTQSVNITDQGPSATTDIVAYFDTISTGTWEVSFDMYVETGDGAYFNIQQNHAIGGVGNQWNAELYFQPNGSVQVQHSAASVIVGNFTYTQGSWFTMSTFIDLDNDSIWFEVNGSAVNVGYVYSAANVGQALQFNGVNFYSGVLAGQTYDIDYYVDDFCVSPANLPTVCNPVTQLSGTSSACDELTVSWSSNTGGSIIEYGPSPLTAGTGTFTGVVTSPQTFTGLTPGVAYDVLVADTCGNDTSSYSSTTASVANAPLPVAAYTSTLQVATLTGQTVNFNGSTTTAGSGATYTWDYGDGNSGTGVTSTHIYTANGTYNACLIVADVCGTDTTCQQIVIEDVSLTENVLSRSLEIFPNPATDVVNVSFNAVGDADVSITVTDAQGRAIMNVNDKLGGTTYQKALDVSKLASGVYMIKVTSGDLVAMRRVSIGK